MLYYFKTSLYIRIDDGKLLEKNIWEFVREMQVKKKASRLTKWFKCCSWHSRPSELLLSLAKYEWRPLTYHNTPPPLLHPKLTYRNHHSTTCHYGHILTMDDCSTHLELITLKSEPGMTEWDFRTSIYSGPTPPKGLRGRT